MRRSLVAAALLAAIACGKRGDPHPPVPLIPKATSDLVVAQRGNKVILSWSFPSLTTAGQKLGRIRRIVVYRYVEPLPVTPQQPRQAGDVDTTLPTAISLFAKVPPIGRQQFTRLRQRVDALDSSDFPAATEGAKLVYEDSPPFHSSDGRPLRLDYAVVTEGATARSDMSNIAAIVPIDVAAPPQDLTATAKAEGIVLAWKADAEKPRVIGYDIYRLNKGEELGELATPVNATPVALTTYTDTPAYGAHTYVVTAVTSNGPPRIESDPSAPASAEFKDLVPPPVPAGLTALVETKAIRLIWDPVQAPDLAGYHIYRTEGTGLKELKVVGRIPLTTGAPLTDTHYTDNGAQPGISYFYEVTSVDKSGNESKPAKTDWVLVPKTP
ncbi:MAG TPA: hypothetical protein VJ853_05680 [Thermoanaerobaculia bacterium]|nr:hypothetical protein [Thermoanaerobaculia bacterium]